MIALALSILIVLGVAAFLIWAHWYIGRPARELARVERIAELWKEKQRLKVWLSHQDPALLTSRLYLDRVRDIEAELEELGIRKIGG